MLSTPGDHKKREYSDKETAISYSAAVGAAALLTSIFSADREFVISARGETELELPPV